MSTHIGAAPGEIAETVLLPGDPYRARWAAETFLDGARLVSEVRGMLAFTGSWRGAPVTVMGTGMGMPSVSIYVNELIRSYGAARLIRIGSCGGMAAGVKLRDIVIAMTASSIATPSSGILRGVNFAPVADWALLRDAVAAAEAMGISPHVGGIYSSDTFYDERDDRLAQLTRHGALAVEMETAELYLLAARYGVQALTVLTVSDLVGGDDHLSSEERERSFGDMVEIALRAALGRGEA